MYDRSTWRTGLCFREVKHTYRIQQGGDESRGIHKYTFLAKRKHTEGKHGYMHFDVIVVIGYYVEFPS